MSGCRYNTCNICEFKDLCQVRQDYKEIKELYNNAVEKLNEEKKAAARMRKSLDTAAQEIQELRNVICGLQKELERQQEKINQANALLYSDKPDSEIQGALMELL